jgi:hypothetical protein
VMTESVSAQTMLILVHHCAPVREMLLVTKQREGQSLAFFVVAA